MTLAAAGQRDRRNLDEAKADLAAWLVRRQAHHSNLTARVEENIEGTLSHFRLPQQHHRSMKSTNMPERVNREIKRRTRIVGVFPNDRSCLRPVRALAIEFRENRLEANRHLSIAHLKEHGREHLRKPATSIGAPCPNCGKLRIRLRQGRGCPCHRPIRVRPADPPVRGSRRRRQGPPGRIPQAVMD